MKKTYTRLRWEKAIKDMVLRTVIFILFQAFIVCAAIFLLGGIKDPITENNSEQITFYADSVEVSRKFQFGGGSQHSVIIYKDGAKYFYQREWFRGRYGAYELRDKLVDKKLYITYGVSEKSADERLYGIVGIASDDEVFYSVDEYNAKRKENFIGGVVIFSIMEVTALVLGFFATREFVRGEHGKFIKKRIRRRKIDKERASVSEICEFMPNKNNQNVSRRKLKQRKKNFDRSKSKTEQ